MAHQQRKFEIIHMLQYIQFYITRQTRFYRQNGSNKSNLCLEEKIEILRGNPVNTLSQKNKIVSKC